jgi:acyl-CoA thioesterase-2
MTDSPTAACLVEDLVALMRLETVGEDRFRGQSEDIGTPAVFGGQVLGQAVMAASLTVEPDRPMHSMHAYFLLPGEHAPIDYTVDRVRDGRSFTTRHVLARQEGRIIFEMAASFQTVDEGIEHQLSMPETRGPKGLPSELEQRVALGDKLPSRWQVKGIEPHGIEYRRVEQDDLLAPVAREGGSAIWMRAVSPLPDEPVMHRALLAYASDHGLLRASMVPHGLTFLTGKVRAASLDHAMWFHREFRFDDWLLYVIDSPSASGARGLCRGSVFTRDGRLVASTAQEGMVRVLR